MVKLLVGLLKGAVIGGAVGYGAYALWQATAFENPWLTFGLIGSLVGFMVGRAIWSLIRDESSTFWVALIKGFFGFGVGCGLYALVAKVWNPSALEVAGHNVFAWHPTLGAAIGGLYGAFVELDDSIGDDAKGTKKVSGNPSKQLKK